MKKNEKNTSATIDQTTATAPAATKKPAAEKKPAPAIKTGDGKIAVVVVERDSLTYYKDVKAPTMVLKSDDFGALLNAVCRRSICEADEIAENPCRRGKSVERVCRI